MISANRSPWFGAAMAISLAALGGTIAWHHPLGGEWVSPVFAALLALGLMPTPYFLLLVPAAMPVIGLAPWTGWLTFEEFDLLVLGLAGGAYLRLALKGGEPEAGRGRAPISPGAILIVVLFGISVLVSMFRGFADAGGFSFGWFQGYYEAMNSVRLAKSFFLALCLLPLCLRCYREDRERSISLLAWGMAIGLGLASLAAIWERAAFTGLLDFSSDYRTTALFWEMHVGGAAFDGFLALTVPFAGWLFFRARSSRQMLGAGLILALAAYACLTTFSRGVYLAIPLALGLMAGLAARPAHAGGSGTPAARGILPAALMTSLFGLAAYWIFPTSGYRGMFALCLAVALYYPVRLALPRQGSQGWLALVVGAAGAALIAVAGHFLPKGAYLVFALGVLLTVAGIAIGQGRGGFAVLAVTLGGYLTVLAGLVSIALHWGGEAAGEAMIPVSLALLVALFAVRRKPLPLRSARWHASLFGALLVAGFAVATFSGGRYMTERFSTAERDMATRLQHWEAGLAQLDAVDWLLGKGLGRYPASHFFAAPAGEHPGGYRHVEEEGGYLLLSGGQHINGWGEIFRVVQRVSPGTGPYGVTFDVRTEKDVRLHFEVCEKHLLYNAGCVVSELGIKGQPGQWQRLEARLPGAQIGRGAWYAPRLLAFSMAMESRGGMVHLDNLSLHDGLGEELLSNADFSDGLAHWFSSSDKHHMPWHMKSLFFHTLFDQGGLGLAALGLMVFAVFWRLTAGNGRRHPLAPVVVGSLAGFLVVGLFDSLLDVPRLATLFYFVLMLGLFLDAPKASRRPAMGDTKPC